MAIVIVNWSVAKQSTLQIC